MDLPQLLQHSIALGAAYALALPLGWDREKNGRSAGVRTFPIVALASCGFVQATEVAFGTSPDAMARIVEGVITGIGFIGGGAILKEGSTVRGTATAASLWVTGAIGVACGLRNWDIAILAAVATFTTLRIMRLMKPEGSEE